jgi:hypothetical protein
MLGVGGHRSAVGGKRSEYDKGLLIMRRTSLIFVGAIAGVGLTLIATHPRTLLGGLLIDDALEITVKTRALSDD